MRVGGFLRRCFVVASLLMIAAPLRAEETATVHGRLSIALADLSLADAGGIVAFLHPRGGEGVDRGRLVDDRVRPSASIRQRGARFEPDFLVVARGQTIEMPNDDVIYHNVFSYSEPNEFDLGMYASGESRSVRFAHGGLVRIYCSIHDEMDGLIFVAPSPFFTTPDSTGRYSIAGVPPGRYRLHVWSERLPEVVKEVDLRSGDVWSLDVVLGRRHDAD